MAQKRTKNLLGQYFTPRHVAELMLSFVKSEQAASVLEPSSGQGIFLDVLTENGFNNVTGVEIDPLLSFHHSANVLNESFFTHNLNLKYDLIIGNPPYIRWKDLDSVAKEELKTLPHWNVIFNSLSDYLIPFIFKSVNHLAVDGELIFVTPSYWMHTQHSLKLREWMITQGEFTDIVKFDEASVFPGVASSIIIFRFVKRNTRNTQINLFSYVGTRKIPISRLEVNNRELFEFMPIPQFLRGHHWTLASQNTQERLDKLENSCVVNESNQLFGDSTRSVLGDVVDIANGMVSGLDSAFKVSPDLLGKLNQVEKAALIDVTKAYLLEPLYTVETVHYINIPEGLDEVEVSKNYPNLFEHLKQFEEELSRRYSYERELPIWEWAFRRSEMFFMNGNPKAFVPCKERLTSKPYVRFAMVPVGTIATQDVTAFAPKAGIKESLEYIVAFLTLPEITDWIKNRGLMKGGVAEFSERPLSEIPLRRIDWTNIEEVQIHDQIFRLFISYKEGSNDGKVSVLNSMHELIRRIL